MKPLFVFAAVAAAWSCRYSPHADPLILQASDNLRRMLAGESAVTRYVRLGNEHEDFRRMAIVRWGLTDREAKAWCGQFVESVRETRSQLPDSAFRFSAEGRAVRRIGNRRATCH